MSQFGLLRVIFGSCDALLPLWQARPALATPPKKREEKDPCKYDAVCYLECVARHKGGIAQRRLKSIMIGTLIISGVLGGIAALVFFEAIGEARKSSGKLHDRYHE